MARNMTEYVFAFNKVKKNILTSLGVKLREKIILLNKYKNLSSEGASTSEFKFLESEVPTFLNLDDGRRRAPVSLPTGRFKEGSDAV